VMKLDPKLAMRFTDRALAQDEFNVEAALVRARIHQHRNEPEEAHRFATVAAALDANRCARETTLMSWLAAEGLAIHAHADSSKPNQAEPEPKEASPVALEEEPEEEAATVVMEEEDEPVLAMIAEEDTPEVAAPVEESVLQSAAVEEPRKAEPPPSKAVEAQVAAVPEPKTEATHAEPEAEALLPIITPKSNAHTIHKASAITLALVIHAILILLLGLLVVIVPEPPVAELVGIIAPEADQEQPQTKQITPTAMPTPTAVAAAPARAITAAGISSISLPDFESKSDGPIAMDIATTDLGASFAMPFSPKGTSQVNFFGIKSQGRRVAFLIDVERYMLTDPRGGYPAYEIVKNEIAGMIGKLGLETYFNVILYEGNAVSAYSDKLLPATTANKDKIRDWLYPVNRDF
ncbi:MAG: hypothetical protein Q8M07_05260, partial [Prosthecobacter sp.]|nr:hypothetical protein [Prosthecobacter sp.]